MYDFLICLSVNSFKIDKGGFIAQLCKSNKAGKYLTSYAYNMDKFGRITNLSIDGSISND